MYVGVWEPQHSKLSVFSLQYEEGILISSQVMSLGWCPRMMVANDYSHRVKYLLPLGDALLSIASLSMASQPNCTEIEAYAVGGCFNYNQIISGIFIFR